MEEFINILWKSSLSLALFYSFHKILLQNETFFKSIRYFLLFGIFTSIFIPFLVIPRYIEMSTVITSIMANENTSVLENTMSIIRWDQLLLSAYLLIALFFIARFIIQIISITNLIKRGNIRKETNINYVETNENVSPFSFFNYIVYNPKQFSVSELEQILSHEKVHVHQKHSIDNLLVNLLASIQWFNPFVWLYKKEIYQNLEYSADLAALKKNNEHKSYQKLLLKTSFPNYQMALANNFYNSLLKKRIIMLQQQRSSNNSQWKFTIIIPLLIAFIFAFNVKTIAQQKKAKVIEEEVDIFALVIDKTSTKEYLKEVTTKFEAKGLNVKFKSIKRNNGEITSISIDAKAKNGKASASHSSILVEGISPIQISYNIESNNLSIGSTEGRHLNGYTFSGKGNSSKKILIEIDEDENSTGKNVTKKEILKIKTKKDGNENEFMFTSTNGDKQPLFILDGKEITKKEMESIDPSSIESINVYKDKKAIEKYGKRAINGVVAITTKKE